MKLVDWSIGAGSFCAYELAQAEKRAIPIPTHLGYNLQGLALYAQQLSDPNKTPNAGTGLVISLGFTTHGAMMRVCQVLNCGATRWIDIHFPWMGLMTMPQPQLREAVKHGLGQLAAEVNKHYEVHKNGEKCDGQ